MTHAPADVQEWVAALFAEAGRDLIFLWNITNGSLGGGNVKPDAETLEAVVSGLVTRGCSVGFGDPDSSTWGVPAELRVPNEQLADEILHFLAANRAEYEFLVFAVRDVFGGTGT
ncbi:hypothetical protein [Polaromonas sp.]|uniref:hypothetical protein n=1 Tax=Polaromonas sp. TaxID=1869339 RepID=UPI002488AE3E|nr:hypothetical protein [Polaromonas sp.]MDI1272944.1 hypothetical protein [Polaromonas sp.]